MRRDLERLRRGATSDQGRRDGEQQVRAERSMDRMLLDALLSKPKQSHRNLRLQRREGRQSTSEARTVGSHNKTGSKGTPGTAEATTKRGRLKTGSGSVHENQENRGQSTLFAVRSFEQRREEKCTLTPVLDRNRSAHSDTKIERRHAMNILLWVLQILGALLYGASRVMKVFL